MERNSVIGDWIIPLAAWLAVSTGVAIAVLLALAE